MRAFKYRFEKILTYRRHQEKQRQRDLAAARELERAQRDKIVGLRHCQEETQTQRRNFLVGHIETARLSGYYRYFLKLQQLEAASREMLRHVIKEVNKRREALVEASREKKIYEKLKERHREKFQREYTLYMQKETDEIGQKAFLRNR